MDSDVIVVGAGLSGLVVAHELAAAERSVIMLDGEPLDSIGRSGVLVARRTVHGELARAAAAPDPRLRASSPWPTGWAVLPSTGRRTTGRDAGPRRTCTSRPVSSAAGCTDLGVRWFPLVQWAERGGYAAPGHGNSVPRFHVTWGTGPGVGGALRPQRAALAPGADPLPAPGHITGGWTVPAYASPGGPGADRCAPRRPNVPKRGR